MNDPTPYDPTRYDPTRYEPTRYDQTRYDQPRYDQSWYDQSWYDQPRYDERPQPSPRSPGDDNPMLWFLRLLKILVFFVYAIVVGALIILTLGFALRLFGASTDAAFTRWVYRNDERLMEPFRGMFPSETVGDHSVLDFSLLFGMVFYAILAILFHALVAWLSSKISRVQRGQQVWT